MSPVRILAVTVSDTRTEADDTSGARLAELLEAAGFQVRRHPPLLGDLGRYATSTTKSLAF